MGQSTAQKFDIDHLTEYLLVFLLVSHGILEKLHSGYLQQKMKKDYYEELSILHLNLFLMEHSSIVWWVANGQQKSPILKCLRVGPNVGTAPVV